MRCGVGVQRLFLCRRAVVVRSIQCLVVGFLFSRREYRAVYTMCCPTFDKTFPGSRSPNIAFTSHRMFHAAVSLHSLPVHAQNTVYTTTAVGLYGWSEASNRPRVCGTHQLHPAGIAFFPRPSSRHPLLFPVPSIPTATYNPLSSDSQPTAFISHVRTDITFSVSHHLLYSLGKCSQPMAPPTGPRAGGSNRPTRGATRGATRGGGIGKRRGTPRTDRDGDVSMDSISGSNPPTGPSAHSTRGSRGGRGGRSTRTSTRLAQNVRNYVSEQDGSARSSKPHLNKVTLKILGLKDSKATNNPDGGLRSLLDFLERKSSKDHPITLGRVRSALLLLLSILLHFSNIPQGFIHGEHVWIKVNPADAPHLLRLNGFTYAGAPLTIEETTEPMPGTGSSAKDSSDTKSSETKYKLLAVIASRYNAQQKLLDFSALGADQILHDMGAFKSKQLAEKSFKALLRLTETNFDNPAKKEAEIQAVTVANNDILDVVEVFTLAHTLPRLRRLDLSSNKLEDFSKLSKWRHEFRRLEELHLVGNPLTNLPNYPAQVIEWFPNLQILDGHRVRAPEEAAEALKAWFPAPLPRLPSNLRDGENNVASTFLQGFFSLYDHDRVALARQFYDDDSVFSLATGSEPATSAYHNYSRNLESIGVRNPSTQQRLFGGVNVIAELWSRLPATRHASLDLAEEWKIDCHTFPSLADPSGQGSAMGLTITVDSRFEELDPTSQTARMRPFSRCFILGPSKPGAPHPYRVVSDVLTLQAWVPQATNVVIQAPVVEAAPAALAALAAPVAAGPPVLTEEQQLWMVQEVMKRTGMNAEYSRLCLTGTANWNLDLALQVFEEKRADLPPEAFAATA